MAKDKDTAVAVRENKEMVQRALDAAHKQGSLKGMKHTQVQAVLESMRSQIAQALPRHLTPERQIQIIASLITRNPSIAECTLTSLVGAVVEASILGFKPIPSLGECYFVPYNMNIGTRQAPKWVKEVQMQIGYRGYISLARRSAELKTIFAECVYSDDTFKYTLGLEPMLEHIPNLNSDRLDKDIKFVYAVAHYKDGGYNVVVLTKKVIENLRMRNPAQKEVPSGAWKTDYPDMAKAKVIKKLSKYMPLSESAEQANILQAAAVDEAIIQLDTFKSSGEGLKLEDVRHPELDAAKQIQETTVARDDVADAVADAVAATAVAATAVETAKEAEVKKKAAKKEADDKKKAADKKNKKSEKTVNSRSSENKEKSEPIPETLKKLMDELGLEFDKDEDYYMASDDNSWCVVNEEEDGNYNIYYGKGDSAEVDEIVDNLLGLKLLYLNYVKYSSE